MKTYTFEITVYEGRDHFWDEINKAGKSGCDEVREEIKGLLESGGYYFVDGDYKNIQLTLKSFKDEA